jgi:catechol 2,3-dioxygenase-like lactoylglutathione lyase family enzyme
MKPRIDILTIAVDDLERSLRFYRDGLGLPAASVTAAADHIAFRLEGTLSFVLYERTALARDAGEPAPRRGSPPFLLSHYVDDRSEVDALLARAEAAGATRIGPTEEQTWGYFGRFRDLDGHVWEVLWNTPR